MLFLIVILNFWEGPTIFTSIVRIVIDIYVTLQVGDILFTQLHKEE